MAQVLHFLSSARVIALLTLCSRVLGLLRECIFGYYFSTSELLSAFRIAFMTPNLARRLFGEGALSSALIPTLTRTIRERGEEESRRFVGSLLAKLAVVLVVIVVAAEVVLVVWRSVRDDVALELTSLLMPYLALICTVAVASGVLNVRRHFAIPAAAPAMLNLCVIVGIIGGAVLGRLRGLDLMYVVCWSVLVGGVVQLVATAIALRRAAYFPIFGKSRRDPAIRQVLVLMGPMVLGLSAVQLNTLADYVIAYLFVDRDGARIGPAVLGYAQYLYQLPLGVFGISLATALFPLLSQKAAEGDRQGLAELISRGIRLGVFVALPATAGLMFVARPLVATLYERGAFEARDTQRVAATLTFYSLGLAAYFLHHVLVRSFHALHNSRTPARIALCMVGVNLALNLSLVFVLEERGLALATALCAIVQVAWLAAKLAKQVPEVAWRPIATSVGKSLTATAIMAASLQWLIAPGLRLVTAAPRSGIQLVTYVAAGVMIFAAAARLLRLDELNFIFRKADAGDGPQ